MRPIKLSTCLLSMFLINCAETKTKLIPCLEPVAPLNYQNKIGVLFDGSNFAETPDNAELYGCINAPDVIDHENKIDFRVVYSIKLENVPENSILIYASSGEVSNETPKPMFLAWYIVISDSPINTNGVYVTRPHGFNISPNMHHGVFSENGSHLVTENITNKYLNVVLYGASGETNLDNESLKIEQNYGELNLTLIKGVTNE